MTSTRPPDPVDRHVARMRRLAVVALAFVAAAAVAGFAVPRAPSAVLSPVAITVLVLAAALWVAFSAERDARLRLERVKRVYAVHGDRRELLRGHLWVYSVVLVRLALVSVAGVVVAVAGVGAVVAVGTHALAATLVALTWPNRHKALLLVDRAERMRGPGP